MKTTAVAAFVLLAAFGVWVVFLTVETFLNGRRDETTERERRFAHLTPTAVAPVGEEDRS